MGQRPDSDIPAITWSAPRLRHAILLGTPIPEAMRSYVASLIPDTIPARGRGHPKNTEKQQAERWIRMGALDFLVRFTTAKHKWSRRPGAITMARGEVAAANNISPDTLKKYSAQFRRAPLAYRHMYPDNRTIALFLATPGREDASINGLLAEPSWGF